MAVIYKTVDNPSPKSDVESLWLYNGLDSCLTLEVFQHIEPQLNEITGAVYEHAKAMQAPILEMQLRGVRIDQLQVKKVAGNLERDAAAVKHSLQTILREGLEFDLPFDKLPHYTQLQELFYNRMGITPIRQKGKITTNRAALEKIRNYFWAEPVCNHIIKLREIRKKLGVLYTGVDPDGRMRTTFSIAGTDTGRLSSYESFSGSGTNLQNITEELRRVFVADKGKKLAYIDLEQAESRAVGAITWNLFGDGKYLDFCESGDLHTGVSMMTWKDLKWYKPFSQMSVIEQLRDLEARKHNKMVAGQLFYREDSYRQSSKKLGHASNYHGQPPEISRQTRIPVPLVSNFQSEYFGEFPAIPEWHKWVAAKLRRDGWITSFMGRQRWFFGRPWDNETLNAAIAYEPQGAVGDYMNKGLLALWRATRVQEVKELASVEILLQVHDALLIQYDEEREAEIIPKVQSILEIEVPLLNGRSLKIPTEAMTGWNWSKARNEKKEVVNPDGLEPFSTEDKRRRSQETSFLDRRF